MPQQKITPCLWFEGNAEEAVRFYLSVFPNSSIEQETRSPSDYPGGKAGNVLLVAFTLAGQSYSAWRGRVARPFSTGR